MIDRIYREKALEMIKGFVDKLGLNGEYYVSKSPNCLIKWYNFLEAPGKYIEPSSEFVEKERNSLLNEGGSDIEESLEKLKYGIIYINPRYKNDISEQFWLTLVHEMIHANRNLYVYDVVRDNTNENAYSANEGRMEQNTMEYGGIYVDPSQDLLKGSIDNSVQTIKRYEESSAISEDGFSSFEVSEQMYRQEEIDEALVEIMANLSYKIYKDDSKDRDIWELVQEVKEEYDGSSESVMCELLLRHKDFELFEWMLDPITYSFGDLHYDFFADYTRDDTDLIEKLERVIGVRDSEEDKNFKYISQIAKKVTEEDEKVTDQKAVLDILNALGFGSETNYKKFKKTQRPKKFINDYDER